MSIDFEAMDREDAHRKRVIFACLCLVLLAIFAGIYGWKSSGNDTGVPAVVPNENQTLSASEDRERRAVESEKNLVPEGYVRDEKKIPPASSLVPKPLTPEEREAVANRGSASLEASQ